MYIDRIKAGVQQPVTQYDIVRESPTTAVVDGHHGMGQVIGVRSMQLAIDKARQYGMGSVAVRNSTHFGIDGYYAMMAANQGFAGMCFTNARPSISPTFGVQPMLGTNPIAFACPTDDQPFVFDAATSIAQRGKFEVLGRERLSAPEGWVVDANGHSVTDAKEVTIGLDKDLYALLPLGGWEEKFGGHKGYGLATMVEIFSASFQTGAFLHDLLGRDAQGKRRPYMIGHFFMAINIESFVPLEEFKKTTSEILRELRNSTKAPNRPRIYTAGEKEYENEHRILAQGVPVVPDLQNDIRTLVKDLGLTQYSFSFLNQSA
ncbi:MAG: Ldh family oxidoreductase, partial [Anaerolineaceae bacterium]|nr:Ldh family oxidoreductase [Anaerolineaceae bacterium]